MPLVFVHRCCWKVGANANPLRRCDAVACVCNRCIFTREMSMCIVGIEAAVNALLCVVYPVACSVDRRKSPRAPVGWYGTTSQKSLVLLLNVKICVRYAPKVSLAGPSNKSFEIAHLLQPSPPSVADISTTVQVFFSPPARDSTCPPPTSYVMSVTIANTLYVGSTSQLGCVCLTVASPLFLGAAKISQWPLGGHPFVLACCSTSKNWFL